MPTNLPDHARINVMLDIETLGRTATAPILTIGAVEFTGNVSPWTGRQFYARIDLRSTLAAGAVIEIDTLNWWLEQNADTRAEAMTGTEPVEMALARFAEWYRQVPRGPAPIWSNGADFDLPILAAALDRLGREKPWPYWAARCFRTLRALAEARACTDGTTAAAPDAPAHHEPHNALSDATRQACAAARWLAQWHEQHAP